MALEHDRDQLSSTWSQNGMRTSRNELIEVHRNISVEKKNKHSLNTVILLKSQP